MRVDLHCHSTCSDGSFAPEHIGSKARDAGVQVFCLTDHDSCEGSAAASGAFAPTEATGARTLRGVELSCRENNKTVHLLIYDVGNDDRWTEVDELLQSQRKARRHRLLTIAARLEQRGIRIDAEAILVAKQGQSVGRPDIAKAMVEVGAVSSQQEAFSRYLYDGGLADVPINRIGIAQALELAKRVGARVSLAHPHQLGGMTAQLFDEFRADGLDGIEAFYQTYSRRQRKPWLELVRRHKLVATGGSDFHGEAYEAVTDMGVDVPEPYASALRDWLEI